LIVRSLILHQPEKVFDVLKDYYAQNKMKDYSLALHHLKDWKNGAIIVNKAAGGKQIADCFWSAWAAYSKFQNDFNICVTSAISLGNDANSTGAVAGSLAGLNGIANIPQHWLDTIVLSSEVMEVIQVFVDLIVQKINK